MQQQNIPIGTLVDMYKRGELRLPEIQRHYVWRATRVRDLLDSLYRGYPSGSILMWETDEPVPTRDFAIAQDTNAFAGRKLLQGEQQTGAFAARLFSGASTWLFSTSSSRRLQKSTTRTRAQPVDSAVIGSGDLKMLKAASKESTPLAHPLVNFGEAA